MTTEEQRQYDAILDKVDDPAKAQPLYLRWKCLTDLYFLGADVLGWKNARYGNKKHVIYPPLHRWLAHTVEQEHDKLIMVFRKALKSSWVKAAIVQNILKYPNRRNGLFSATPRLVRFMLADIGLMLANPLLLRLFPDILRPPGKDYRNWEKKTQDEITVHRDSSFGYIPQEPQVTALGNLAKVTGLRIDYAFPDDIIDPDTVRSAVMMEKSEDWWAYIRSCLSGDGYTTVTGTFYHYSDLYNKIIAEKHIPHIYIRPVKINGKIQYPNRWTQKELDLEALIQGAYIFNCQYNLDAVPKGEEVFPAPQPTYADLPQDEYKYYITVDPAPTTHDYSDKTGVIIAAVNRIKHAYIVEAQSFKKKGDEIAEYLIRKCVQYKPQKVGIEFGIQVELQRTIDTMRKDYENRTHTRVQMPVVPVPITSKMTKLERVNYGFASQVRLGKVKIHVSCIELLRQMDKFTGRGGKEQDDLVDAASMLSAVIDGYAGNYYTDPIENFVQGMTFRKLLEKKDKYEWTSEFANYSAAS